MNTPVFNELIPYTECPLCTSDVIEEKHRINCTTYPHFRPPLSELMVWMECSACKHSFRNGFYTDAAFEILFDQTHPNQTVGINYERQRYVWAKLIDKVLPYSKSGLWIDVGFGDGALLLTVAEYGFNPLGIDLRKGNVEKIRSIGIRAECLDFSKIDVSSPASVISMCDVLEHMQFPIKAIISAHRNLKPNGVLLLSMPNSESPVWKLLDKEGINPYWKEMEHFHNFSRNSLYKTLESNGFIPMAYGVSERYRACMEVVAIRI